MRVYDFMTDVVLLGNNKHRRNAHAGAHADCEIVRQIQYVRHQPEPDDASQRRLTFGLNPAVAPTGALSLES